jgi:methionine-S-sulfoxide reductase
MRKAILLSVVLSLFAGSSIAAQSKADASKQKPGLETATFAGGCFWCMQPPFDKTKGVVSTVVGYTGGQEKNPTYEQVSSSRTGHREAIQVKYDPAQVSYDQLLDVFWRSFDPTQADGQFADIGPQYRAAVYFHSEEQKRQAEESKRRLAQSGKFSKPIVTEILPAGPFYAAEEYHQKYYLKHPEEYRRYAVGSGRYPFLERTWGVKK